MAAALQILFQVIQRQINEDLHELDEDEKHEESEVFEKRSI